MEQLIKTTYTLNYLKIYVWQILSICLNLGALFIVLPSISTNKEIYGIYSVCISFTIFLSYADLGFINAGTKYAAEAYATGNVKKEKQIIGFVSFILFVFILIFSVIIGILAFNPHLVFTGLKDTGEKIASQLLGTLALFAPVVVIQRSLQIIFSIRLEDYILQAALIIANLLKIISVFFFFGNGHYNITGYFLCYQLLSLMAILAAGFLAQKKYRLSFFSLGKCFSFSKEVYMYVKKLAFSSLFVTGSWILFYELDPYVLAKLTTPETVAVYAVGLTLLSFYRSIFGALFNPFTARFNHLIGLNDEVSLRGLYSTVIIVLLPIVVFAIVPLVFFTNYFIYAWLGSHYEQSIWPARLLILSNILAYITYPASIMLVAKQRLRTLNIISAVLPILYWSIVLFFFKQFGISAFAGAKLITFLFAGILYLKFSLTFLKTDLLCFIKKYILPIIPSVVCIIVFLSTANYFIEIKDKNYGSLLLVILLALLSCVPALVCYYFFSHPFRTYILMLVRKTRNKLLPANHSKIQEL